jgi:hypothetical protein
MRILTVLFLSLLAVGFAQFDRAPNGYYPPDYAGEIFSGRLVTVDAAASSFTLEYKQKRFVGKLKQPCKVPNAEHRAMNVADLPKDSVITAFFRGRKENGAKFNEVFGISFKEAYGKEVKTPMLFSCTDETFLKFKVF